MAKFGLLNVVRELARAYCKSWDEIVEWQNSTVLVDMQMGAEMAWVEFRMRQNQK
jgi:hypothetical protein